MLIELFKDEFKIVTGFRARWKPTGKKPIKENVFNVQRTEIKHLFNFLSTHLCEVSKNKYDKEFGNLRLKIIDTTKKT